MQRRRDDHQLKPGGRVQPRGRQHTRRGLIGASRGRLVRGGIGRHRVVGPAPSGSSGSTIALGGSIGSFPIPPGAQVLDNVTTGGKHDIVLGSITAAQVATFYTQALSAAGYTITSNASGTSGGAGVAGIDFTGHGYRGQIGALTSLGISFTGLGNGAVGITLDPA